ncbi:GTPase IMAP family member 8-like [Engraulis encrasicolus]|uniref:GTPase IMAP family member 8-like n=1 Tax=Engraulis encrasicolus TaxID=184585 RepID=UPI002FD279D7
MAEKEPCKQHELRVVVLGAKRSGKTSLIDRILGSGDHSPRTLQTRQGEVGGRAVVMVDTVGWWRNFMLVDTAEFIKQKLQLSVSMCPPGPHAFLLTVMTDIPFNEDNRRAIEEHLSLFGENIWQHTIVVFIRGGTLEGKTVEEHIKSEGEALKWLVEKCGNRYCVFEIRNSENDQASKLLGQIDTMIRVNDRRHFQADGSTLREVEDKTKTVTEKAADRRMNRKEEMQRQGKVLPKSEITILMLGWVTSRKTTAKNIILNRKEGCCTERTKSAEMHIGETEGVKLSVVDTPGWWKYFPAQATPACVKEQLQKSLPLASQTPHAILLAVPADTTFLEEQRKITEDSMMMFGEQVWRHTMVLFTCGDLLADTSIEEHIESEGAPLKWLVEKCGNRYHVFDGINRGDGSQVRELLEKIKKMEALNESFAMYQAKEDSTPENETLGKVLHELWEENNVMIAKEIEMSCKKSLTLPPNCSNNNENPVVGTCDLSEEYKLAFKREIARQETVAKERFWRMYLSDDDSKTCEHDLQAEEKIEGIRYNWTREWCRQLAIRTEGPDRYFQHTGDIETSWSCQHHGVKMGALETPVKKRKMSV